MMNEFIDGSLLIYVNLTIYEFILRAFPLVLALLSRNCLLGKQIRQFSLSLLHWFFRSLFLKDSLKMRKTGICFEFEISLIEV